MNNFSFDDGLRWLSSKLASHNVDVVPVGDCGVAFLSKDEVCGSKYLGSLAVFQSGHALWPSGFIEKTEFVFRSVHHEEGMVRSGNMATVFGETFVTLASATSTGSYGQGVMQ